MSYQQEKKGQKTELINFSVKKTKTFSLRCPVQEYHGRHYWAAIKNKIKLSKDTPATHPLFMPAEVMSQILYAYVKEQRRPCPDTNSWWKYGALMTKFKVIQMSWIHVTNCPMVIHSCVSQGMTISKDTKSGPNTNYVKNPINVTLRSKVNVVSASWNHETHWIMVMNPCAECQGKKR